MRISTFILSTLLILVPACASPPDQQKKIDACRKITDKNFRDRCIADALGARKVIFDDEALGSEKE